MKLVFTFPKVGRPSPTIQSGPLRHSWFGTEALSSVRRPAGAYPRPRRGVPCGASADSETDRSQPPPWLPSLTPCGVRPFRDLALAGFDSALAASRQERRTGIRERELRVGLSLSPVRPTAALLTGRTCLSRLRCGRSLRDCSSRRSSVFREPSRCVATEENPKSGPHKRRL